ncbi:MAG: hypothetical protein V1720_15665 [bacterium]
MKNKIQSILLITAVILLTATSIFFGQDNLIGFDSGRWNIVNGEVVEFLGRKSLCGIATLNDVEFQNGIIEVDIAAVSGKKSYFGVLFRMQNMQDYERLYIRPHRSIFYDDAIQYLAVFNGVDSWQFYSGSGITSPAKIPTDTWNHLKIEISGTQAKVYLNDMENAVLNISELKHGFSKGMLGLNGPADGSAYFSNFTFRATNELNFESAPKIIKMIGIIKDWEISDPLATINCDLENYPTQDIISSFKWQPVKSDETGLVDISRYYARQYRLGDCIYARTIFESDRDTTLLLNFGYSDYATIFLNGTPVFFGNSAYQSRDKSFLGIIGYFDHLFFPVKKGKNELMILVAETFGGWGFMFRDANAIYVDEVLSPGWIIKGALTSPESIVFDKANNLCYVSCFFNEGKEYISKISLEGKIIEKEWITGLNMPTGICISEDRLYILDRRNLNIVDIHSGELKEKIPLHGLIYPNDIVTDKKGTFYISDSRSNSIYKFSEGKLENWLSSKEIGNPNGLLYDDEYLFVGVGIDGTVKRININSKGISTFVELDAGSNIDGIKKLDENNFLISDYNGFLYKISGDGEKQLLINSKTPQQSIANFEYIPTKKLILIPTVLSNKILSFTVR